jgi:hypothetical protein
MLFQIDIPGNLDLRAPARYFSERWHSGEIVFWYTPEHGIRFIFKEGQGEEISGSLTSMELIASAEVDG